MIIKPLL